MTVTGDTVRLVNLWYLWWLCPVRATKRHNQPSSSIAICKKNPMRNVTEDRTIHSDITDGFRYRSSSISNIVTILRPAPHLQIFLTRSKSMDIPLDRQWTELEIPSRFYVAEYLKIFSEKLTSMLATARN